MSDIRPKTAVDNLATREDEHTGGPIVLVCEPLLVAADGAAQLCGFSSSGWRKLDRTGLVPRAIAVGKRRLWSVAALRAWTSLGCPGRAEFEAQGGSR